MVIQHNMAAMTALRQSEMESGNLQKNTKKISSGYKINNAADGAADLSISEEMRAQIRGLSRSADNAKEGASFIQTADGAMNEVHDILHRMRELAVQALNDTNVESDRAALAEEFDKLQSEIDRISKNTDFNTQPVFQEHAPSYYQIIGNRKWEADQKHSVMSPDNELSIHLPAGYNPSDYKIIVEEGIYTTQELIDELDDAFSQMRPSNPGFVFEFTDDGFCNLNFESEDGTPVKIDSVDGGLAYLIYDCVNGSAATSLLGTTAFQGEWPLSITAGQNDELNFYIEKMDGSPSTYISLKISPPGEYTRSEMIDYLNRELGKNSAAAGVVAKEYGSMCIQITGGSESSITGLKGNMFKLEAGSEKVYTSVFYDNVRYGTSSSKAATVTGVAYYRNSYTTKYEINDTNNTLRFKLNGSAVYTEIKLDNKEYTISELVTQLNDKFREAGVDVTASSGSVYTNPSGTASGSYNYLRLTSGLSGADSSFEFDTTVNSVFGNTYDTLFRKTNFNYFQNPDYYPGDDKNMQISGQADLSEPITIKSGANTLSLSLNNEPPFSITIPERTYNSLADLISELNNQLPALAQGKIQFISIGTGNNFLGIKGAVDDVTNLSFGNTAGAYEQLFTGTREIAKSVNISATGREQYTQGGTAPDIANMATVTLPYDIPETITKIDKDNNRLGIYLNGSTEYVTLNSGSYTRAGLIDELNRQFTANGLHVKASLSGNRLTLTTTLTGSTRTLSVGAYSGSGTAWKAFLGTQPQTISPVMPYLGSQTRVDGKNNFSDITINDDNNTFILYTDNNKNQYPITLAKKSYTMDELITALQDEIDKAAGLDKNGKSVIEVKKTNSGIQLISSNAGYRTFSLSGDFYQKVLGAEIINTYTKEPSLEKGTHAFSEAFIVGRQDLTNSLVEIIAGANDSFIVDFTYNNPAEPAKSYMKTLEAVLPEGIYSGEEIAAHLKDALNKEFADEGIADFEVDVTIGGHNTGVTGSNDASALQISIKEKTGNNPESGTYYLDGVRGNASGFIFYKTTGKPIPSYVTGARDISEGITFEPGKNVMTFNVDADIYSYSFPEDTEMTADEVIAFLNDKFKAGDDTGKTAPLEASLEDGRLKISHRLYGNHKITEISGSAKGVVFYMEENRDSQSAFMLQVGALEKQGIELPRLRINTVALGINSVTISNPKYADKALSRLEKAVELLNERRTTYGALQNRLNHSIANNENTSENLQAGESILRDADIAFETILYYKNKIMIQASEAILAQANQNSNGVLSMLR